MMVDDNAEVTFERLMFMDFVHRPILFSKTQPFENWICFRLQVKKKVTPTLLGPLERASFNHCTNGPSKVGATFFLPEDGNRSSFRKVVFLKKKSTG
jgi:hypothetical protein